jgi:predicted ATPase
VWVAARSLLAMGDRPPAIVGRDGELEAARHALSAALGGRPGVLLVTGEAGIGKTRLVEELRALAVAGPGHVLVGLGESAPLVGVSLAYGPFVAAFPDRAQWLLADEGATDGQASRHRLFGRVLGLVSELAATGSGLVLVLEDLH